MAVSVRASEGKIMASDWCGSGLWQRFVQVRDTGALGFMQGGERVGAKMGNVWR